MFGLQISKTPSNCVFQCHHLFKFLYARCYVHQEVLTNEHVSHIPVMADEVLHILRPQNGEVFVDMTFGSGGHTERILNAAENVKVFALDRDPHSYDLAKTMAEKYKGNLVPLLGKFSDLPQLLSEHGVNKNSIDGFLFDVGCSSMQFDQGERGFSIRQNGPLDMRMDANRLSNQPTAADVVNSLEEGDLTKIFKVYGEEKHSRKIAQAIIEARFMFRPIRTTHELADLVADIVNKTEFRKDKLNRPTHAARKVFQALRIFVNDELNELNKGLFFCHEYLKSGGIAVVITFHSLEDKVVKKSFMGMNMDEADSKTLSQKFRNAAKVHTLEEMENLHDKKWRFLNKHVITPTNEEVDNNPRSRSAKLRAAVKLHPDS